MQMADVEELAAIQASLQKLRDQLAILRMYVSVASKAEESLKGGKSENSTAVEKSITAVATRIAPRND
jgi:hypothetical protein